MRSGRTVLSSFRYLVSVRTWSALAKPSTSPGPSYMDLWRLKSQAYHASIFSPSIQVYRSYASSSAGSDNISYIKSENDFKAALRRAEEESSPSIFYFTAAWCGPCRLVSPLIDQLSSKYPLVKTYKVDIDQEDLGKTLSDLSVTAVPTLHFFKDGKKAAAVVGADVAQLKQVFETLYG